MREIKLSTGRTLNANGSILGLRYDGKTMELCGGYDSEIRQGCPVESWEDEDERAEHFTPAERREIADRMIALWNKWAAP